MRSTLMPTSLCSPAFTALIHGFTMRSGGTRRSRMATMEKRLTFALEKRAASHSRMGTMASTISSSSTTTAPTPMTHGLPYLLRSPSMNTGISKLLSDHLPPGGGGLTE
jgi:hypothetical protein